MSEANEMTAKPRPGRSEATGTVSGPLPADAVEEVGADGAAFGPLDDPPRADGVELIGEPVPLDEAPHVEAAHEGVTEPSMRQPPPGLESSGSVPNPLIRQPGFVLPQHLMQRLGDIGLETSTIAAHVAAIEQENAVAESGDVAAATEPTSATKES